MGEGAGGGRWEAPGLECNSIAPLCERHKRASEGRRSGGEAAGALGRQTGGAEPAAGKVLFGYSLPTEPEPSCGTRPKPEQLCSGSPPPPRKHWEVREEVTIGPARPQMWGQTWNLFALFFVTRSPAIMTQ